MPTLSTCALKSRERRYEMDRRATIERNTKETNVSVTLNLDGSGTHEVDKGIG